MEWKTWTENVGIEIALSERKKGEGRTLLLLDVDIKLAQKQVLKPISLRTSFDALDVYSVWSPGIWSSRHLGPNWSKRTTSSRLSSGAPIHSLVSLGGQNRMTAALSDAAVASEIRTGIVEETAEIDLEIRLFTKPQNAIDHYHATVYLDFSDRRYEDAARGAELWWREECGYACAPVPDVAKQPMYSTWYSFHQNVSPEEIVRQCRMAKELGMESVIVDDGWQTEDESRGYAYCGDWEVSRTKIPDMKAFVDAVHALDMKFLMWYSVPFVGKHSRAFKHFSDMFLGYQNKSADRTVGILDPRYPEVRRYLVELYVNAVRDWGLDGLKLDFIDSFQIYPETPAEDARRDTPSLEEGVDRLLDEITRALRAIKPEILIEFRQSYVGPHIRKYGNMLRVCDCPADALINRRASTDLRLICGESAVHSDMIMWNTKDTVEAAAIQMLTTLFCVPQISVLLDRIPETHRRMLAFYLAFWKENREILLNGRFYAENPEAYYTLVSSEKDGHLIALAYTDSVLTVPSAERISYVNASCKGRLAVRFEQDQGVKEYQIYDCMGNVTASGMIECRGLKDFEIPQAGILRIG
jgi:alpha-galactosidase